MKKALILSGINWNATWQRHHNVATYLVGLGYHVYFIEGIPSSKFSISKLFIRIKNRLFSESNKIFMNDYNVEVKSYNFVNPMKGLLYIYNKYKAKKLFKEIGTEFDLVINYLPINTTLFITDNTKYNLLIYDCVRDFENWGGYTKDVSTIERKTIKKSHIVLTDSYYLKSKLINKYEYDIKNKLVQILPTINEKQRKILNKAKLKSEVKNILYFGTVGSHIDINIFKYLIDEGYSVHVIGEVYSNLKLDDRIVYHGFISDMNDLSESIINYADAIILPYIGNMDGVIPAKLMQCFATGLPIYITNFYDARVLKDYLCIYEDYGDLKKKLLSYEKKAHEERKDKMIKFTSENLQEIQFLKLEEMINRYSDKNI